MSNNKKKNALGHDPFADLGGLDLWDDEPLEGGMETAVIEPPTIPSLGSLVGFKAEALPSLASLVLTPAPQTAVVEPTLKENPQPTEPKPTLELAVEPQPEPSEEAEPELPEPTPDAEPAIIEPNVTEPVGAALPDEVGSTSPAEEALTELSEEMPVELPSIVEEEKPQMPNVADAIAKFMASAKGKEEAKEEEAETAVMEPEDRLVVPFEETPTEIETVVPSLATLIEDELLVEPNETNEAALPRPSLAELMQDSPTVSLVEREEEAVEQPDWALFEEAVEQPVEEASGRLDDAFFEVEESNPFDDDDMWLNLLDDAEQIEETAVAEEDMLVAFEDVVAADALDLDVATEIALEDALNTPSAEQAEAEPKTEMADALLGLVGRIDGEMAQTEALAGQSESILEPEEPAGEEIQHIIFEMARLRYAVPIGNVLEITQPQQITAVPNVPEWLVGVTNLRGDILSLVNFRSFLSLPQPAYQKEPQMLVIQDSQAELVTGLIVDKVHDMQRLQENNIGSSEVPIPVPVKPYASGVYDLDTSFLVVLNINSLLNSNEMRQFETAA